MTKKLVAVTFLLVGLVTFGNMLGNDFIGDDVKFIINNPQVHNIDIPLAFSKNGFNTVGQYRPITVIYFSALYSMVGETAWVFHVVQLGLHIATTMLLFLVFKKFINEKVALGAALIFLVHPLNVESVAYIGHTDSTIYSVLGLSALLIGMKSTLRTKDYLLMGFLIIGSIGAKEAGILFLPMIVLYSWIYARKNFFRSVMMCAVVMGIYFWMRIGIGQVGMEPRLLVPITSLSLGERILNIPAIIYYYISQFIWPNRLAALQSWVISVVDWRQFYLPLIVGVVFLGGLAGGSGYVISRQKSLGKPILFFWSWFLIGMGLYLQIIPLDCTVANHWFYFPMMGLLGLGGIFWESLKIKWGKMLVIVVAGLSVTTMVRNTYYRDEIKFFENERKISDTFDVENELGVEYEKRGELDKALWHMQRSVEMRPYEYNLFSMGAIYENKGDFDQAFSYYTKALDAVDYKMFRPHKHDIRTYIRYTYMALFFEKIPAIETEIFINKALEDYPESPDLWFLLALNKFKGGDKSGALETAMRGYQIRGDKLNETMIYSIQNNINFQIDIDGQHFVFGGGRASDQVNQVNRVIK